MYHRFFLVPKAFVLNKDETTRVFCNLTDNFLESDAAISNERIKICKVSNIHEEIEIKEFSIEGKSLVFDVPKLKDGLYFVQMVLKTRTIDLSSEKFNSYLMHENLAGILNLIETKKLHKDVFKEKYTHHAKTIIKVGNITEGFDFKRPLGWKIELIPLIDPFNLKAGDILPVQVLYDGEPLSFAALSYGDSQYPYTTQTDENGLAKIKLWRGGTWFVHSIHMIPAYQFDIDTDWESFWATFTFGVSN